MTEVTAQRAEPILEVAGLRRTYGDAPGMLARMLRQPARRVRAVDGVDLRLRPGETMALVGESGCGKSTVARCVAGLESPSAGTVRYSGETMERIARRALPARKDVQMVFQDPYSSLNPRWPVGRSIAEPMQVLGLETGRDAAQARVAELLSQVGLAPEDAEKFPHQFSGGQRQRVAIARALSTRPKVIICDEPTSALDVSVQAQILNMMKDLQEEYGLAYLFITHDLGVVDHMADRVAIMYLGRIVEIGSREAIFARPRHPYTRMLMDAVPRLDEVTAGAPPLGELPDPANPPSGCAFRTRCPWAIAACAETVPPLEEVDGRRAACLRSGEVA
ncbi:ATP-binding cassette domain-containing protein [Roseicyclus sp. F158]|uniref:ATP-binding cassette domain-containing protein n=1 Tax=Tropicimonas omnivorans TaxID=3075590 RepID=A0ABU3DH83_9RHOB|nr:oligopeptide/dipeptide ABC transporter ATP-binding protein [Roseicyclus sp. F158]MDT0683077.1 ATP-binding cassette domain-containing protein [Roseicyclus sp. F158]